LIPASASVKAAIVARDPHELGERALLNLGHTFGHAIETVPALQLLHGEAVAIGMVAAAHCAHAYFAPPVGSPSVGSPNEPLAVRVERLLSQLGLPIRMPLPIPQSEIRHRMGFDKKNQGGVLRLVLARKMGDVTVVTDPPEETVLAGLAAIGAAGESAM
jgi:3-dehydroquinate synthetase